MHPPVLAATASGAAATSAAGDGVSAAALFYVLYRQRQIRPLRSTFVPPLVLTAFGVGIVVSDVKTHPFTTGQVGADQVAGAASAPEGTAG